MKIRRSYRFRIYPSAEQIRRLDQWSGALRFLWNLANEQRLAALARPRGERPRVGWVQQGRELTQLRAAAPWLADTPRRSGDAVLKRLHVAWAGAFARAKRRPRFQKKGDPSPAIELDRREVLWAGPRRVSLAKLGSVAIVVHRAMPGRTIGVALTREAGDWFVVFTQEIEATPAERLPGAVGIDRGIVSLIADSDGRTVEGPRFAERSARKLKRVQRALSRTSKGSSNRAKARLRLARAHRKVRRQRDWLQHQISHDYAKSHGVVVIEKLETARMTRSARGTVDSPGRNVRAKAGLNRSILDAGWSGLAEKLRYKLEERGGELVEVPAAYSSQTCSACGVVDAASRRTQSEFCCVGCGHEANADINAARVILSRWNPPVQPVEACDGAA